MKTFRHNDGHRAVRLAALYLAGAVAFPGAAGAGERVCVVCEAPDAQYSCSLAPSDADEAGLGLSGAALKVRCLREIAETYGHRSCKVGDTPITTCAGTVHMLAGEPKAAGPATGAILPTPAKPSPTAAPADEASGAPKTVVEMAKRTAGKTQAQLEKSGEAVERAARQTWRCVASLFTACNSKLDESGEQPSPSPTQ